MTPSLDYARPPPYGSRAKGQAAEEPDYVAERTAEELRHHESWDVPARVPRSSTLRTDRVRVEYADRPDVGASGQP